MTQENLFERSFSRRRLLQGAAIGGSAVSVGLLQAQAAGLPRLTTRGGVAQMAEELVIDLSSEPANLDPATTYEVNGWSIVHSVYDAPVQYGADGSLELILLDALTPLDAETMELKLKSGIVFHSGEPFDASSVKASIEAIQGNEASQIAGNFATIASVEIIDPLTVHLKLSAPSPWLPAQMAAWLACLPPSYPADLDLTMAPIGTGPYKFVEWVAGERIVLEANEAYPADSPKGAPIAKRVVFRFIPDATTRVADLLGGSAHLVRGVPVDEVARIEEAGAKVVAEPLSGIAFLRIPTDVAPFDDVRVRQALNHAVDVQAIIDALNGGHGTRLSNLFVPSGLGYDPNLAPYSFDPEKARALLADAGHGDGISTRISVASTERVDLIEAIAAQMSEAGIQAEVEAVEIATFNGQWKDPEAAPLRFVTWRPMFDPFTLLSLVFSNAGFLSRHDNPTAQALIDAAATEIDPAKRADLYRQLGTVLHDEPGAVYLWSLTSLYGVAAEAPAWTPRADDYILPTQRA